MDKDASQLREGCPICQNDMKKIDSFISIGKDRVEYPFTSIKWNHEVNATETWKGEIIHNVSFWKRYRISEIIKNV